MAQLKNMINDFKNGLLSKTLFCIRTLEFEEEYRNRIEEMEGEV